MKLKGKLFYVVKICCSKTSNNYLFNYSELRFEKIKAYLISFGTSDEYTYDRIRENKLQIVVSTTDFQLNLIVAEKSWYWK